MSNEQESQAQIIEDCLTNIERLKKELTHLFTALEAYSFVDKRWLAIAKTDYQKSNMSLTRAVLDHHGTNIF